MIQGSLYPLVTHATDLHLLLGFRTDPSATPPPIENDFANQMKDIWINFVNDLNPGGMALHMNQSRPKCSFSTLDNWPRYEQTAEKPVMQLQRGNTTLVPDGKWYLSVIDQVTHGNLDFDLEKTDFINSVRVLGDFSK
jgi:hypothetical protein